MVNKPIFGAQDEDADDVARYERDIKSKLEEEELLFSKTRKTTQKGTEK